jgi:hypothetical protein
VWHREVDQVQRLEGVKRAFSQLGSNGHLMSTTSTPSSSFMPKSQQGDFSKGTTFHNFRADTCLVSVCSMTMQSDYCRRDYEPDLPMILGCATDGLGCALCCYLLSSQSFTRVYILSLKSSHSNGQLTTQSIFKYRILHVANRTGPAFIDDSWINA